MNIRQITIEEIEEVLTWDKDSRLGNFPDKHTFVVEHEGDLILMSSLILTNVDLAWVENTYANPKIKMEKEKRQAMTRELLKFLEKTAIFEGYSKLFCLSPNEGLSRYYKKLGFEASIPVTCFIKELV